MHWLPNKITCITRTLFSGSFFNYKYLFNCIVYFPATPETSRRGIRTIILSCCLSSSCTENFSRWFHVVTALIQSSVSLLWRAAVLASFAPHGTISLAPLVFACPSFLITPWKVFYCVEHLWPEQLGRIDSYASLLALLSVVFLLDSTIEILCVMFVSILIS